MSFVKAFLPEFDNEMRTTRSLLERVPMDNGSWKPHPKSTGLGDLASHIANLASFGKLIVETTERDFAAPAAANPAPTKFTTREAVLEAFDKNVAASRAAIEGMDESTLGTQWTLRAGEHVIFALPKGVVFRTMLMNHVIHHRGQLSVYLRLNDVPLPSIYGPTADT